MVDWTMNKSEAFLYLVVVATTYRDYLRKNKIDTDIADGIRRALIALGFTVEDFRTSSRYLFNGQDVFGDRDN